MFSRHTSLATTVALLAFCVPAIADDVLDARRERIDKMSPEMKDALRRKRDRFNNLPPKEQQRLRDLHVKIESHPKSDELKNVLQRYNEWLKTLSTVERSKLLGLPADERIARIKKLMAEQQRRNFGIAVGTQLPAEDVTKIFQWVNKFIIDHEKEMIAALPPAARNQLRRANTRQRRVALLWALARQRPNQDRPLPSREEIHALLSELSPQAQEMLAKVPDGKRAMIVQRWIQSTVVAKLLPPVDDATLEKFYFEELSEKERQILDRLSEQMQRDRLLMMYHSRHSRRPATDRLQPVRPRPQFPSDQRDRIRDAAPARAVQ